MREKLSLVIAFFEKFCYNNSSWIVGKRGEYLRTEREVFYETFAKAGKHGICGWFFARKTRDGFQTLSYNANKMTNYGAQAILRSI